MRQPDKTNDLRTPEGAKVHTTENDLWYRHGVDDIHFQRSITITFLSIMIGLASGALLSQFFALLEQVQASRWHLILYFAASVILLINTWVLNSWGTLVLKWPIMFSTIIPAFLIDFTLAIMCLLVTNPPAWTLSAGVYILLSVLGQIPVMRSDAWRFLSSKRKKELKIESLVYLFCTLIAFAAAAQMYLFPSKVVEIIWGVIACLVSIASMLMQHKVMQQEKKEYRIP